MKETIKNSVQQQRLARNITQEELATIVSVTRQTIIAIEKGNYAPSVHLAINLARFFKVPVETLFTIINHK